MEGIEFEIVYKINSKDFGKLLVLLGVYYNVIVVLFIDIYYLININLLLKLLELLVELEIEFFIEKCLVDDLF